MWRANSAVRHTIWCLQQRNNDAPLSLLALHVCCLVPLVGVLPEVYQKTSGEYPEDYPACQRSIADCSAPTTPSTTRTN